MKVLLAPLREDSMTLLLLGEKLPFFHEENQLYMGEASMEERRRHQQPVLSSLKKIIKTALIQVDARDPLNARDKRAL